MSQNPVLRNITDYLIEEASAEEEELLGQASETEDSDDKDQAIIKVYTTFSYFSSFFYQIIHSSTVHFLLGMCE